MLNKIYSSKWTSGCIKMLSIWKKMRERFKTLFELKLKFIPKAWKWEAMAHKTPFKGCLFGNRDSNSTFILFCLDLTNGLVA